MDIKNKVLLIITYSSYFFVYEKINQNVHHNKRKLK